MLQVIGLIVAVYAMVRVIQVPIEMTAGREEWLGLPFKTRSSSSRGSRQPACSSWEF